MDSIYVLGVYFCARRKILAFVCSRFLTYNNLIDIVLDSGNEVGDGSTIGGRDSSGDVSLA